MCRQNPNEFDWIGLKSMEGRKDAKLVIWMALTHKILARCRLLEHLQSSKLMVDWTVDGGRLPALVPDITCRSTSECMRQKGVRTSTF